MSKKTLLLVGLLALAVGVTAIICYDSIHSQGVTIAAGIFFVAVGIINLIAFGSHKDGKGMRRAMMQLGNAGAIIFGICLLVFRAQLNSLVQWVFGIALCLCALWLVFVILMGIRPRVPMWTLLFPLAMGGCAAYTLMQPAPAEDQRIVLATGIGLCIMGAGSLAMSVAASVAGRAQEKLAEKAEEHKGKPADSPEEKPADSQEDKPAEKTEEKPTSANFE